jgi:hypothetical protein
VRRCRLIGPPPSRPRRRSPARNWVHIRRWRPWHRLAETGSRVASALVSTLIRGLGCAPAPSKGRTRTSANGARRAESRRYRGVRRALPARATGQEREGSQARSRDRDPAHAAGGADRSPLPCPRSRAGPSTGRTASINRYFADEGYVQPVEPHRMTRGGSSWPSTFRSSVLPSVSSARRVSSGRASGSADQTAPLISIVTRATWPPRLISHSHPLPSTPARPCRPRPVLISQIICGSSIRSLSRFRRSHVGRRT